MIYSNKSYVDVLALKVCYSTTLPLLRETVNIPGAGGRGMTGACDPPWGCCCPFCCMSEGRSSATLPFFPGALRMANRSRMLSFIVFFLIF